MEIDVSFSRRHNLNPLFPIGAYLLLGPAVFLSANIARAQSVCLPAPRLLTTVPMGGQAGSTVEVEISGEHLEDIEELRFSDAHLSATPKTDDAGNPVPNLFVIQIADDCPSGIHEARVMSRLGVSSSRVFCVDRLPEVTRQQANTTAETAMPLPLNTICNASTTNQSIDYYSFECEQGQRIVVDCAADGIDSKLTPVLIVGDKDGNDLQVERRGGVIDFSVPESGRYMMKVHDLTYNGGPYYFYRLVIRTAAGGETVARFPSTQSVSSCSWPPAGLAEQTAAVETEPNNDSSHVQQISVPCDLTGSFFPAADVDVFEFQAKKGEVWWVEVASERLGRPTDPFILVQQVRGEGAAEEVTELVELTDIGSPVKVSSNGYAYDGPPYNAGSPDIIGKVDIPEDGRYRLQLSDLFGGTRNDPNNIWRLIIRRPQPDFSVVAWAMHMELRNGDRNALSKPIALRGGATMPFEVAVVRRDGFDGDINLTLENLPDGVTASGLKIPAGQTLGHLLVTADQNAPRGLTSAKLTGTAQINGETVSRTGRFASMAWPVPNAWAEIPKPRLLADMPVSVGGSEFAPVSIAVAEPDVLEVAEGGTLKLPLTLTRRSEFSGNKMSLTTMGVGFTGHPAFDAPLDADAAETVLDLAKLKPAPGDYAIAFYGSAVAKYRYNPDAVTAAEATVAEAKQKAESAATEAQNLKTAAEAAPDEQKEAMRKEAEEAVARQQAAEAAVTAAEKQLQAATKAAEPKDIVDIVVSEPIRIRVTPAKAESP
ncbi:MAG: serine protease [Planctomycetaceae bacterium]|nr:serine protease [Planctomycetaceae bacterium]